MQDEKIISRCCRRMQSIQDAQIKMADKKNMPKRGKKWGKLSTIEMAKTRKKRVIHEVMHIIHRNYRENTRFT